MKEDNSRVLGAKTSQGMQLIAFNVQNVSAVENITDGGLTRGEIVSEFKEVFKGTV